MGECHKPFCNVLFLKFLLCAKYFSIHHPTKSLPQLGKVQVFLP